MYANLDDLLGSDLLAYLEEYKDNGKDKPEGSWNTRARLGQKYNGKYSKWN